MLMFADDSVISGERENTGINLQGGWSGWREESEGICEKKSSSKSEMKDLREDSETMCRGGR